MHDAVLSPSSVPFELKSEKKQRRRDWLAQRSTQDRPTNRSNLQGGRSGGLALRLATESSAAAPPAYRGDNFGMSYDGRVGASIAGGGAMGAGEWAQAGKWADGPAPSFWVSIPPITNRIPCRIKQRR